LPSLFDSVFFTPRVCWGFEAAGRRHRAGSLTLVFRFCPLGDGRREGEKGAQAEDLSDLGGHHSPPFFYSWSHTPVLAHQSSAGPVEFTHRGCAVDTGKLYRLLIVLI